VSPLHAGIVEDTVESGEFFDDFPRGVPYGTEVHYIQNEMPHSGICGADAPQTIFAAAADNDLVSQPMKCFGEPFPDARGAARDKNCVGMHFHEFFPYNS
jgi:hypothetical protein